MKIILLLLVFFIVPQIGMSQARQNLVIIGDSLTEGYGVSASQSFPALLEERLSTSGKPYKVINNGISGSTSASAVSRVKWILKNPPNVVLLALGANDGLRGLKTEATQKNLDEAIQLLKQKKIKVILIGMKMPPNYKSGDYAKKFESIYPALAKKHGIPLVPFLLEGVAGVPELNLKDGIHPNVKGHVAISQNLFRAIFEYL